MTASNPQHEPTMEEILASIRRIISDDESAAPAPEPVLELTDPAPEPMAESEPEIELDALDRVDVREAEPAMEMVEEPDDFMEDIAPQPPIPTAAPTPKPAMTSGLMSERPAGAAAQSFAKLVGAMAISGHPNQTLEDVVKDLLRPLLQEWLDTNLPGIVEAEVAAELTRITRMGRP